MFSFFKKKRIYLDHAATTPLDPDVLHVMNREYCFNYYNPGGLYQEGVRVGQSIRIARAQVAASLETVSDHIIFTRGGTESNNVAVLGVVDHYVQTHPTIRPHVIVSEIEHAAVLETVKDLARQDIIDVSYAPVTNDGIVDMDELKKLLRPETILVSVMYVNNEIGTIQPIRDIAKLVRWYKKQNSLHQYPLVHTDAIQAVNYLDLAVDKLGVDLMSLSGSKIYGPKSSGAVYVRNRTLVSSMFHGGGQEFGLRAGTEDVASMVGFAHALGYARSIAERESIRQGILQHYFLEQLQKKIPHLRINGSLADRIPNNVNISVQGISGEQLVIELDAQGICAASKSACKEDNGEVSHVIAALRKNETNHEATDGSLRFTLGRGTKKTDVDRTVLVLTKIVERIRTFEKSLK